MQVDVISIGRGYSLSTSVTRSRCLCRRQRSQDSGVRPVQMDKLWYRIIDIVRLHQER